MKFLQLIGMALRTIVSVEPLLPACKYPVYCNSSLLYHVQMARIFPDSKKFVDYQMRNDANVTLAAFQILLNQTNNIPTKNDLTEFVRQHFTDESELEDWVPLDYKHFPTFVSAIKGHAFHTFAEHVHSTWPLLGKQIKSDVFDNQSDTVLFPYQTVSSYLEVVTESFTIGTVIGLSKVF